MSANSENINNRLEAIKKDLLMLASDTGQELKQIHSEEDTVKALGMFFNAVQNISGMQRGIEEAFNGNAKKNSKAH